MTGEKTVLVVDDHNEVRSYIVEYIRSEPGYAVVGEASSGQEAVALAASLRPDVIFMDISMPVMSGIEAVRRIREHFPVVKIVFVTIHDGELFRTIAEFMHVDGYVCKNSLISDLRAVLHRLKLPGGADQSARYN